MVNMDVPHRYFEQGRSVIAFSGHYGNWEMMYSYKLWEKDVELIPIYKPIHNKVFDRMTCKIRSRFGATPLAKADTLRVMLRNQQEGKIADRAVPLCVERQHRRARTQAQNTQNHVKIRIIAK